MKKVFGFIPVRMGSSRFPGKPLVLIHQYTMLEHVWHRAAMYSHWAGLFVCTCDEEIQLFCHNKNIPVVMTADTHDRALDRVAEAAKNCPTKIDDGDIVVCIQGDEPMMQPDMIDAVCKPFGEDASVESTVLSMHIVSEDVYRSPDAVKLVADIYGDVLYNSRAPIPHCNEFSEDIGARRIYGIFGFLRYHLEQFTKTESTSLELLESCDSNRICGSGIKQRIAPYPYIPSFSVDRAVDRELVEREIVNDSLWGKY